LTGKNGPGSLASPAGIVFGQTSKGVMILPREPRDIILSGCRHKNGVAFDAVLRAIPETGIDEETLLTGLSKERMSECLASLRYYSRPCWGVLKTEIHEGKRPYYRIPMEDQT
jgi:hypothetical protein